MNNSNYFNFKKVFLTVFLSGISLLASAQVVTFTDTIFRQAVTANPLIDLNDDGLIQLTEAAAFNGAMDVSNLGINELTGIEAFTSLYSLNCNYNLLTSLDVSAINSLVVLNCLSNSLISINVSNNPNLFELNCSNNFLTGIDVSALSSLNIFYCYNNVLLNLDVSSNLSLYTLYCFQNQLNTINLNSNTALNSLYCGNNFFTSVDVSNNTNLAFFSIDGNNINTIDLSANTNLYYFICSNTSITNLDLTGLNSLTYLNASNSGPITNITFPSAALMNYIEIQDNQLTGLNVNSYTGLTYLNVSNNLFTSLDLTSNIILEYVSCAGNQITNLDLSNADSLTELFCNNNQLESLNIQNGNNIDLVNFDAVNNTNLTCVQVDNIAFMDFNWASAIDATASYSLDCDPCGALPTPQFTLSSNTISASPATVVFTNTTPNLGLYDFLWHFGDGSAMNNDNAAVNYTYNTNGNFEISLTLNDPLTGCSVTNYDPANAAQTVVCSVPSANICGFTPSISPNGVINACQGSTVELNLNAGSYPAGSLIQWNKDGVTVIGENYTNHYVTENGFYTVTIFSPNGCPVVSDPVQVQYNLPASSEPSINATGTSGPCGQINLTLTANGSFASYLWSNGQTGTSLNVTQAGVYSVIGQSGVGCNVTSAPFAVSTSTFSAPEICMIDVDSLTNHAVIIWEKPITNGILGFGIYRETPLYSENYQQIAIVPYDSLSEFMDINSDESLISERYRISIIDSCNGGETSFSAPARAMGLKVLPGVGFQRVLTWNYYVSSAQNFTTYNIYSGPNLNSLSLLTSVPASINTNYIDANPISGLNTVYRIYADMIIPCESTRALRNRSISNGTGNLMPVYTAIKENNEINALECKLFPNPNNGIFSLAFTSVIPKNTYTIQVFDMIGNIVYQTQFESTPNAEINLSHLAKGVYNIRMNSGNKQINKRLLITK